MADRIDITIEQGATWAMSISVRDDNGDPIDMSSGYSAIMQIRRRYADFDDDAIVTITSDDNIVLGNGTITVALSADATEALNWREPYALYDLEVREAASGETDRVAQGRVFLDREVSRAEFPEPPAEEE